MLSPEWSAAQRCILWPRPMKVGARGMAALSPLIHASIQADGTP